MQRSVIIAHDDGSHFLVISFSIDVASWGLAHYIQHYIRTDPSINANPQLSDGRKIKVLYSALTASRESTSEALVPIFVEPNIVDLPLKYGANTSSSLKSSNKSIWAHFLYLLHIKDWRLSCEQRKNTYKVFLSLLAYDADYQPRIVTGYEEKVIAGGSPTK